MLDKAFEALKTYDWGQDPKVLRPIDDAIVATYGDAAARTELEKRLVEHLQQDLSYDAKQVICRKLRTIGTAACVPVVANLLTDEKLSHMARYALERIPAPAAAQAMRDALGKLSGERKIGMISSLGVRQDDESVPALAKLLADSDPAVARATAQSLGAIRSQAAAKALADSKPSAEAQAAVADAKLACAESRLKAGNKKEALALYKSLIGTDQPKHIRLAATRGVLAANK